MSGSGVPSQDDLVPVSVRLGEVVPPEDPEDWSRPLTWVAALGMLAAPLVALAWFVIGPPSQGSLAVPATFAVAVALAAGAAATGSTQQGSARAGTATLGAGLFGALVLVLLGAVMAGERQVATASPTLAHAAGSAAGGLAGVVAGSLIAALVARPWPRPVRFGVALGASVLVAMLTVGALMPGEVPAGKGEVVATQPPASAAPSAP